MGSGRPVPHKPLTSFGASRRSAASQDYFCDVILTRKVADVWKKGVWEFQAKSGSSGSCRLFLHFLGKIKAKEKKN